MKHQNYFLTLICLFGLSTIFGCRHVARQTPISDTDEKTVQDTAQDADTASAQGIGDTDRDAGGDSQLWTPPKNVILFIGDGMGQSQIAATGMYKNGDPGTLFFESFPVHGLVTNASANSEIPDSAASATAIACGKKVDNGVLSSALPGDGRELYSLVDFYKDQQKSAAAQRLRPMRSLATMSPRLHGTISTPAARKFSSAAAGTAWRRKRSPRPVTKLCIRLTH